MSIWHYSERQRDFIKGPFFFWRTQSEIYLSQSWKERRCFYCDTPMQLLYEEDRLEPKYRNDSGDHEHSKRAYACPTCGWWRIHRIECHLGGRNADVYLYEHASVGTLRNLNLTDIALPLQEVRDFLTVRYSGRFAMHPRLFEQTVGSVFCDLGYDVRVTSYSSDGGIDVILDRDSETIGVQVKRTTRAIEVEQIRTFTGALVLRSMNHGMFVTTSSYRSGVVDTRLAATESNSLMGRGSSTS